MANSQRLLFARKYPPIVIQRARIYPRSGPKGLSGPKQLQKHLKSSSHYIASPDRDFDLETDVSITGLGAVLSLLHLVAYACRSLTPQEGKYSVTELETLARIILPIPQGSMPSGGCVCTGEG